MLVVGGSLGAAGYFTIVELGCTGELIVDGISRVVRLRWDSPWHQISWTRSFQEFQHVQFYQIVDQHGLHDHWRIELLLQDGQVICLGNGLLGAIRRSAADSLTRKVATLIGIPVLQLEKTQALSFDQKHS